MFRAYNIGANGARTDNARGCKRHAESLTSFEFSDVILESKSRIDAMNRAAGYWHSTLLMQKVVHQSKKRVWCVDHFWYSQMTVFLALRLRSYFLWSAPVSRSFCSSLSVVDSFSLSSATEEQEKLWSKLIVLKALGHSTIIRSVIRWKNGPLSALPWGFPSFTGVDSECIL